MSAVAAVAVASPFAVTAVTALTASPQPAPEEHDFVQASVVTDLSSEVISALQSSLSQFGIVVPNMPGILGPANAPSSTSFPAPGGLTAAPSTMATPALSMPPVDTPGLTVPPASLPSATTSIPALGDSANPMLTNPSVPVTPPVGLTPTSSVSGPTSGLTTPTIFPNASLTSPLGETSGLTAVPGEVPIATGLGPDALGTFPLLGGDSSLGAAPAAAPSGGLLDELSNTVSDLGASQAIDLLKGLVVQPITQAIKGATPAAAAPPVPAPAAEAAAPAAAAAPAH